MALTISYAEEAAVYEYSYTSGTNTYMLAGAWSTHLPFSARYPAGATGLAYYAKDGSSGVGSQFEVGIGDYDPGANTLTRPTILASSNNNAAVNWSGRTRLLIRPLLLPGLPLCPTPPTAGQALVWDATHNEWCPGCPICVDLSNTVFIPGVHLTPTTPGTVPPTTPPTMDGSSIGFWQQSSSSVANGFIDGLPNVLKLTTHHSFDVLVAFVTLVSAFGVTSPGAAASVPTVTGISGNGLTWQLRGRATGTSLHNAVVSGITFYGNVAIEEWYAIAPTPQTNATYTATFSGPTASSIISVNAFSGVGLPQIWDSNPALPTSHVTIAPGGSFEIPISTSDPGAEMPLVGAVVWLGGFFPPKSSGWTNLVGAGLPAHQGFIGAAQTVGVIGPLSGAVLAPWNPDGPSSAGFVIMGDALVGG